MIVLMLIFVWKIREVNMYSKEEEPLPLGPRLDHSNMRECYHQVKIDSNYNTLKKSVDKFNRYNNS